MNNNQQQKKKQLNKFVRLTGVGLQMGITIYLAAYFGKKLDVYFELKKNYITITLILFGFIGSLFSLMAQLKKINEKE
ncbi:MAG: AtpZ/AtpI family protein [Flavobacteriaceae bacterium]|nr:AtpZ/AtpI family protein [Flavobacteriaceae bacterium]